jgi:hypothetical protein
MPVKRRASKRRLDWRAELECWHTMFESGFAFDDDLMPLGLPPTPQESVIAEAWQRLGGIFIAQHGRENCNGHAIWALERFGEPDAS